MIWYHMIRLIWTYTHCTLYRFYYILIFWTYFFHQAVRNKRTKIPGNSQRLHLRIWCDSRHGPCTEMSSSKDETVVIRKHLRGHLQWDWSTAYTTMTHPSEQVLLTFYKFILQNQEEENATNCPTPIFCGPFGILASSPPISPCLFKALHPTLTRPKWPLYPRIELRAPSGKAFRDPPVPSNSGAGDNSRRSTRRSWEPKKHISGHVPSRNCQAKEGMWHQALSSKHWNIRTPCLS